jgi:hypothetical protein
MTTNTNTSKTVSNKTNKPNDKKNYLLQTLINYGTVVAFFIVVYLIYRFLIKRDYSKINKDGFQNKNDDPDTDTDTNTDTNTYDKESFGNGLGTNMNDIIEIISSTATSLKPPSAQSSSSNSSQLETSQIEQSDSIDEEESSEISSISNSSTIYEESLNNIYGENKRFFCSLLPTIDPNSNTCRVNNTPYIIYKFPIHMIKLLDDSIVAVFNDGYMYTKNNMNESLWQGPIKNSMPQTNIPLRMITLDTDLMTLLGIGYDNILYKKKPKTDSNGINTSINLTGIWRQVPNNANIIYVLFDNVTNFLISIDIYGNLFTKTTIDITSFNKQLTTSIGRPVLRLYYDLNGYMLAIDTNFDLYQFTGLNWKTTPLQLERGANPNKVHDILYDNDGKLYGLIFNNDEFKIKIMKQKTVFYLSEFYPLDVNFNKNNENNFLLANKDILKCKIGSLYDFLLALQENDTTDEDTNYAFQKQVIESEANLRQFCSSRNANTNNINYDNYELLGNVETNNDKILKLQNVITNLMAYEPDRANLQDKYPILNTNKSSIS